MNAKNEMIEKLLKVAKKHKVLTYPVLALVAIISVFHYFFSWSTGAGKRVVAVVMVLVMLVSQSYFLTSSANALVDDANSALVQEELQTAAYTNGDGSEDSSDKETAVPKEEIEEETASAEEETAGDNAVTDETNIANADNTVEGTEPAVGSEVADTAEGNQEGDSDQGTFVGDSDEYIEENHTEVAEGELKITLHYSFFSSSDSAIHNTDKTGDFTGTIGSTISLENWEIYTAVMTTMRNADARNCYSYDHWYYDKNYTKPVSSMSAVEVPTGANELHLYCRGEVLKYYVTILSDGGSWTASSSLEAGVTSEGIYIDRESPTITFTNVGKVGYTLNTYQIGKSTGITAGITGPTVDTANGTKQYGITMNLQKYLSVDNAYQMVALSWKQDTYEIRYQIGSSDGIDQIKPSEVKFNDSGYKFPKSSVFVKEKPGYEFMGWSLTPNQATAEFPKDSSIPTTSPNYHELWYVAYLKGNPVTLYPVYSYLGILIADDDLALNFEYKKKETKEVSAKCKDYTGTIASDRFTYEINADDAAVLQNTYGIIVSASGNKLIFAAPDGPKKTTVDSATTSDIPALRVTVKDNERPTDENILGVKAYTFKITIAQRAVTVTMPGAAEKMYDGTNMLATSFPRKSGDSSRGLVPSDIPGVSVEFDFNKSYYESENVGTHKIVLDDAKVYLPEDTTGNEYKNYTIAQTATGKITPRPVVVSTKVKDGDSYTNNIRIRAGEASPILPEQVLIEVASATGDKGFVGSDGESALGQITFTTNRTDLLQEGDYEIVANNGPTEDGQVPNYKIEKGTWATFTVKADNPDVSEGGNYIITGTKGDNDWYLAPGATIQPKPSGSVYNTVRMSQTQGGTLIANNTIKEGMKEVWVQLYSDPAKNGTGAVTKWEKVSVKVDETAPNYDNYFSLTTKTNEEFYNSKDGISSSVQANVEAGGLFFPTKGLLTFGNYFNQEVRVTVKFTDKDTGSGLYQLHYGLAGGTMKPVDFVGDSGMVTFSLNEVVVGKVGAIEFYATDKAGNQSAAKSLVRDKAGNWCVETSGPNIKTYGMYSGEKPQAFAAPSDIVATKYYSDCSVVASVEDELAGLYSVQWTVNGEKEPAQLVGGNAPVHEKTFTREFKDKVSGKVSISAEILDNAGNPVKTGEITFMLDNIEPNITLIPGYDDWQQEVELGFDVTDDEGGSGVDYVKVMKKTENGPIEIDYTVDKVNDGKWECYFRQEQMGDFILVAVDKAGNKKELEVSLNKVSKEVPDCPTITVTPELTEENEWYNGTDDLKATISNVTVTSDGTPVETYYQLWKNGETAYNKELVTGAGREITMPGDGFYILKVWAESKTGVMCEESPHEMEFKVDKTAPVIQLAAQKGDGTNLFIGFTITDVNSGVDEESVVVKHGDKVMTVKGEKEGDSYVGSFEITETGDYSIEAADLAGNVSEVAAFTPMSMKINAVKNITNHGATVGANVIKGTSEIQSASIAYRKYADKNYIIITDDVAIKDSATGNVALSAVLSDLDQDTAYVYKITATSELGEVLEYEGYFKTWADDVDGITISGVAKYADESKTGNITVGLFKGNVCNMATEIEAGSQFTFSKVPDGNYNIIATDGKYSKTMRVLIEDGMVVYPTTNIELVLSGRNTSVVITTSNTPNVTVDNMDSIFENDIVNFTNADYQLVETEGGVVEFKLYATLMMVSSVSPEEISAMYAVTDKGKIVGAYLDLSLIKEVTDATGSTERSRVTELGRGASLSVTIPLGELAGKPGLEVVRIHNTGEKFLGQSLKDEDSNPSTYTISTNQFSTYAILYDPVSKQPDKPTTDKPTTDEPEKTEQPKPNNPSIGTNIQEGTSNPSQNGTIDDGSTEVSDGEDEDNDKDDKKKPIKEDDSKRQGGTEGSSVGSLRSSGTAKTGDAAPIAAMGGMIFISLAGIFVLRKKIK